jgi:putative phage-type endonuclease
MDKKRIKMITLISFIFFKNPMDARTQQWVDHGNYWEHKAPQGTQEWLDVRVGRITTSVSGAMSGVSNFKSPEEQGLIIANVKREEFSKKSIAAMDHGTKTEPIARDWYANMTGYTIVERGLIVPKWDLKLGASVDGDIVGTDGIIEIKCPLKMYGPLKKYMDMVKSGWKPKEGYYDHIWKTHLAQMQHAMRVMGKKWCTYIVYSTYDGSVFTQKIPFDPIYWEKHYKTIMKNYEKYIKPHISDNSLIQPN